MKNTLNIDGRLISLDKPLVMGVLNLTEDSFFDGGKYYKEENAIARAEEILAQGADIIDIGACSTRPGAELVSAEDEIKKLLPITKHIRHNHPQAIISIDTVWSEVVGAVMDNGADIINDISGGNFDSKLFEEVARTKAPYILMHTTALPNRMQDHTEYDDLYLDISKYLSIRIEKLKSLGVNDIIIDLGFGFGKTVEQNYELLRRLREFEVLGLPMLVGLSRKSMIYKPLGISPEESLNPSVILNTIAILNGAKIIRVHDVAESVEIIKLFELLKNS